MKLNPYLYFNGNCREAFDSYVKHLGATYLMCLTYADAPPSPAPAGDGPPPPRDTIMHARLQLGEGILMGADAPPDRFHEMAGFSINLDTRDPKEAERLYAALSEKGQIFMPLEETFWAKRFAMFKDRFGVPWMINCEKENF